MAIIPTKREVLEWLLSSASVRDLEEAQQAVNRRWSLLDAAAMAALQIGDTVSFEHKGKTVTGVIRAFKSTKVEVRAPHTTRLLGSSYTQDADWRWPASLLKLVKRAGT